MESMTHLFQYRVHVKPLKSDYVDQILAPHFLKELPLVNNETLSASVLSSVMWNIKGT